MGSTIDETMVKMIDIVEHKMEIINDIALIEDVYNEYYLQLRKLSGCLRDTIKRDYAVRAQENKKVFWEGMKTFRHPDE